MVSIPNSIILQGLIFNKSWAFHLKTNSYLQPTKKMTKFCNRVFPYDHFDTNHMHLLWGKSPLRAQN